MNDLEETPEMAYGSMLEAAHIAGYAFRRTMDRLKYLLTDDRFMDLGFAHVNAFLRTLDLSAFNVKETRPDVIALIKDAQPEAANRAIADALGVNPSTIGRDLARVADATLEAEPPNVFGVFADPSVADATSEAEPPSLDLPFEDTGSTSVTPELDADEAAWVETHAGENGEGPEDWDEDEDEEIPDDEILDMYVVWRQKYPEFVSNLSHEEFRIVAMALDTKLPDEVLSYRQRWARRDQNALAELLGEPLFPERDPVLVAGGMAAARWDKWFVEMATLAASIQRDHQALMAYWPLYTKQSALRKILEYQAVLRELEAILRAEIDHAESDAQTED